MTCSYQKTLSREKLKEFWQCSYILRPLLYISGEFTDFHSRGSNTADNFYSANCVIISSLAFSVLYGMSMKPVDAENWLTGQLLNVLIDVLFMPIIKITISGVFVVYCLKDHFDKYSNVMMNRIREEIHHFRR